jgi:hypothetical protein
MRLLGLFVQLPFMSLNCCYLSLVLAILLIENLFRFLLYFNASNSTVMQSLPPAWLVESTRYLH